MGLPKYLIQTKGANIHPAITLTSYVKHGIKISKVGKGIATDNIALERFCRSAKYETIYIQEFKTIKEIKSSVGEYIEFYNNKRFQQTLNYKKPEDVYNDSITEQLRRVA